MTMPSNCRRENFTHESIEAGCGCAFGQCHTAAYAPVVAVRPPDRRTAWARWPGAIVALATLVLGGCMTAENYRKFTDGLVGLSESDVIVRMGQPDQTVRLPDGGHMLVYMAASTYTTPAQSSYSSGKTVNIFTGKKNGYASTYTYTPEQTVVLGCQTRVSIHRGRVDNVVFEGNYCVK